MTEIEIPLSDLINWRFYVDSFGDFVFEFETEEGLHTVRIKGGEGVFTSNKFVEFLREFLSEAVWYNYTSVVRELKRAMEELYWESDFPSTYAYQRIASLILLLQLWMFQEEISFDIRIMGSKGSSEEGESNLY